MFYLLEYEESNRIDNSDKKIQITVIAQLNTKKILFFKKS